MTISDYVADLRAATPSNAAELAVPDQDALRQTLDGAHDRMTTALDRQIKAARRHLNVLSASPALRSPTGYLDQKRAALSYLRDRLTAAQTKQVGKKRQNFIALTAKLDAMSPLKVLTRGYAMTQLEDGTVVRSVEQIRPGNRLDITLCDGRLSANVTDVKENG